MIFGQAAPKFIYREGESVTVSGVNTTTDVLTTSANHGLNLYDLVTVEGADVPAGLTDGETYYVAEVTSDTEVKLAATKYGTAINLTDVGSGAITLNFEQSVLLDYVVYNDPQPDSDRNYLQSKITGERVLTRHYDHLDIEFRINLFKYSDPTAKFEQIANFIGKAVHLWFHRDGQPFRKTGQVSADFVVDQLSTFYLENSTYKDGLILVFKSLDPIDLEDRASLDPGGGVTSIQLNEISVID